MEGGKKGERGEEKGKVLTQDMQIKIPKHDSRKEKAKPKKHPTKSTIRR